MLRESSYRHYRVNQHIIERLEMDPCLVSDTVTGSSVDPPYTRHTIKINGISEYRLQRNQRIIKELRTRCDDVNNDITNMDDRRLAQILLMRFVQGDTEPSWEEIGQIVGHHPDSCRKWADRYLHSLDVVQTEGFKKRMKRKAKGIR